MKKIPEKAKKMINYLREQISVGHFPPETKLPPIRDLQEMFNISYTSANRGIDYLCSIGVVEKRPRSGVYVKKQFSRSSKKTKTRVALFISTGELRNPKSIYSTVFLGIQCFAEEHQCSLSVNYLPIDEAEPDIINEECKDADAVILLAEYDSVLNNFSASAPAAGICMHNSLKGKLSLIDIDPYLSAELAVEYYQRKKVSKVIITSSENTPPAYINRNDAFEKNWLEAGGKVEKKTLTEKFNWDSDAGYFFPTGSMLQQCSEKCLSKTGKTLAEQSTVLGIDGKNLINPEFHSAPVIALDWQLAGRCAMEECIFRQANPGSLPKRIYLPGRLVE
ncbi:MAG: GntR family transcriptional regulator [Planctomycetota bacterium]|jgi:DNA-binding LacI/PurR family transcriptional regulator